jgi:hypothetical protein
MNPGDLMMISSSYEASLHQAHFFAARSCSNEKGGCRSFCSRGFTSVSSAISAEETFLKSSASAQMRSRGSLYFSAPKDRSNSPTTGENPDSLLTLRAVTE